jgi:hypothetical protein
VKAREDLLSKHMVSVGIVAVVPAMVWLANSFGLYSFLGVVGLVAVAVALYVGMRHPLWLYWALAAVLGTLPFGYFPGIHIPLYLPFAFGVILAAVLHPRQHSRFHRLEMAVVLLVIVAGMSVLATGITMPAIIGYVRWSVVTLVMLALLRLSTEDLERFGRIYVYAATATALFGLFELLVDRDKRLFRLLRPFGYFVGYKREVITAYAYDESGGATERLGATWGPNGAAIALLVALLLCLVLFRGWQRNCIAIIVTVALLLTLNRSVVFTLLVGLPLVFIFHTMGARDRWWALGSFALLAGLAFSVPFIRNRLLASFSSGDWGASDRREALANFPNIMAGHWWFGLGWDRPEFQSGVGAYDYPANAALLTVYRGGIFAGVMFAAVLVIGCVAGARALRSNSLPYAVYGGVFIAFCFVAAQLDHPVALVPQMVLTFSVMLAFLVYIDQSRGSPPKALELYKETPSVAAP